MNNEIKTDISAELAPGAAPVSLDVEAVVRSGRRARRRRVGFGAAGAALSVVVALSVVFALMPGAPGTGDRKSADAATQDDSKLDTDEPVLDPDKDYFWKRAYPADKTDTSNAYTKAFWDYMLAEHPEATYTKTNLSGDEHTPTKGDQSSLAYFMEGEAKLYEGTPVDPNFDAGPVREHTVLNLYEREKPGEGSDKTSCCMLRYKFDGDEGELDGISLSVYPKGSYTKRTGDAMDLTTANGPHDPTVTDAAGPNGKDIQYVTETDSDDPDDPDDEARDFRWKAVVYRADGSAVVVALYSGATDADSTEPNLDFEELRDIALALPNDAIG